MHYRRFGSGNDVAHYRCCNCLVFKILLKRCGVVELDEVHFLDAAVAFYRGFNRREFLCAAISCLLLSGHHLLARHQTDVGEQVESGAYPKQDEHHQITGQWTSNALHCDKIRCFYIKMTG